MRREHHAITSRRRRVVTVGHSVASLVRVDHLFFFVGAIFAAFTSTPGQGSRQGPTPKHNARHAPLRRRAVNNDPLAQHGTEALLLLVTQIHLQRELTVPRADIHATGDREQRPNLWRETGPADVDVNKGSRRSVANRRSHSANHSIPPFYRYAITSAWHGTAPDLRSVSGEHRWNAAGEFTALL